MSKSELKPCPFCGAPYPYLTFERGYIDDSAIVFCNACKISVKLSQTTKKDSIMKLNARQSNLGIGE